jgi:hypothetical protein
MLQEQNDKIKAARRETVLASYNAAKTENTQRFLEGDKKATSEYIYENQKQDAAGIVNEYYFNNRRVVSITKKTKVGADGLMIEVAKLMTTHPDDNFVINSANVRILTGMSNASWEKDMKEKAPSCFRGKIFHHGQLKNADLSSMRDSLIIVDELDTGDKECQVLHKVLKDAGVLDVTYMEQNNIRFMFISATMIKELYELYRWGKLHCLYAMTIPASYIGHTDFLARGIIQEFYPVTTTTAASRWIQEDILDNYGPLDCRIHIIRANLKTSGTIQSECIRRNIPCFNHTSDDKIEEEVLRQLFEGPALTRHVVLIVKGFFRRANLIPNEWKLRIGSTHEFYTKKVDNNVQIQALPGRMSGYWREVIEAGHKTGPYRTSVQAIQQYEEIYNNPFGENSYQTVGFNKKNGKVTNSTPVFVSPKNIEGLEKQQEEEEINNCRIYDDENTVKAVCKKLGYQYRVTENNAAGFKETSLNKTKDVVTLDEAVKKISGAYGTNNKVKTYRTYYPCYVDTNDATTLRFVVIIRPDTDPALISEVDELYPSIPLV